MESSHADVQPHSPKIARLLVTIQEGIFSLSTCKVPTIVSEILQLFSISEIEDMNCIASNILRVYSTKSRSLSFVLDLVQNLFSSFTATLKAALRKSLLDIAFQYDSVFYLFSSRFSDLILLAHFIESGILTNKEVVERASAYADFPSENAFYPALIFTALAPEIKSASESLFDKFTQSFHACMSQNMNAVFFSEIYKNSKELFSGDFSQLKRARANGFIDGSIDSVFIMDDIDGLKKKISGGWSQHEFIMASPFQRRLVLTRLLPIEYCAAVGARECFEFLLEKANIFETSVEGYGVVHYAISGGNLEMLKRLHEEGAYLDGALHFSVQFFEGEITAWLLENGRDLGESHPRMGTVLSSALSADNLSVLSQMNFSSLSLHEAAGSNAVSAIRFLLLSDDIDVNVKNQKQETAVHTATLLSKSNAVRELLRSPGVDVNSKDRSKTAAIHIAAANGEFEIVRLLIARGVNVNLMNKSGDNSLMLSLSNGHVSIAKEIMSAQGVKFGAKNNQGVSALHIAASKGFIDIVRALVSKTTVNVNGRTKRGESSLQLAIQGGHVDIVRYLLHVPNIDVNIQNEEGWSALHYASANGIEGALKLLLTIEGIEVNAQSKSGETALHLALQCRIPDLAVLLLAVHGVDVISKTGEDWTALHFASLNGFDDVVDDLISRAGVDVNGRTRRKKTPFSCAAENGRTRIMRRLLVSGCDALIPDIEKRLPLHLASGNGHLDAVEIILGVDGCDVNAKDFEGNTALHYAARYSRGNIMKLLVDRGGIEIGAMNDEGQTAMMIAKSFCANECIGILEDHQK